MKKNNLLIVFSCFLLWMFVGQLASFASDKDRDLDGLDDQLEEDLAVKFAPSYYFHPEEKYFSDSVDKYLQNTQLRFHYRGLPDDQIYDQGTIIQKHLVNIEHYNKDWLGNYTDEVISSSQTRDVYNAGGYFLEVPDDYFDKEQVYEGNSAGDSSKIYAHVYLDSEAHIRIQYWVFFPYNEAPSVGGVKLNHEGDWEHITIQLDEDNHISNVYFASHNNEGKAYVKEDLFFSNGETMEKSSYSENNDMTHVIVYLARGTHASFPTSGTQYRAWYLPNDYTGEGQVLYGKDKVLNVGEVEAPLNEQYFVQYAGLWGEIGNTRISTGPKSPSFQDSWMTQ